VEKQRIPSVCCQTIPDKQLLCSRVFAQMQRQGIEFFVKSMMEGAMTYAKFYILYA